LRHRPARQNPAGRAERASDHTLLRDRYIRLLKLGDAGS
jgi:hypothetical protein